MKDYSDPEILNLLKSPEEIKVDQGLRILYERLYPTIDHYIQQNSGKSEDTDDVFQDAMIVLFQQVRKADFKLTSSFKTYVYSICRNLWLKKLRKQKRQVNLSDEMEEIPVDETQLQRIEADERSRSIAQLLAQMSEDCRKFLLYFYYEKLRIKEIMVKMSISSEAVAKNKKSNCMKQLRRMAANHKNL